MDPLLIGCVSPLWPARAWSAHGSPGCGDPRLADGDLIRVPEMAQIEVLETDITGLDVDAIANAANTALQHGGGVAGAISRAGGPEVQRESEQKAPIGLGD